MDISININREDVYREVAQTTSYTGAKMTDDPEAYERIFTTDEDKKQLERFWNEAIAAVCEELKRNLEDEEYEDATSIWNLRLNVSSAFDSALLPSINKELFSYLVLSIASKWYVFTNKKEASDYADGAAAILESIHRKVCFKKKPKRPSYN